MAMHPLVQVKAQQELDAVVVRNRLPDHEDCSSLYYIQAILLEVLRWRPPAPLGVPHRVMVEDEYGGYRIPQGTIIIAVR